LVYRFLKLFLGGLHKILPSPSSATVYRAVKKAHWHFSPIAIGKTITWWSMIHTVSPGVLSSPQFLGNEGARTQFTIKPQSIRCIKRYIAQFHNRFSASLSPQLQRPICSGRQRESRACVGVRSGH
jgi:hypothetical protein